MTNTSPDPNKSKLEKLVNSIELFKKLFISLLLIVLSLIVLIFFLKNSFKKQLIIKPFKISTSLQNKGYTGEILTTLFVDKITEIQQKGVSLYRTNKVVLPSWENNVDEINVAFNNSIFSDVKSMFEFLGSRYSQYANGQIIQIDSLFTLQFTIDNHSITVSNKKTIDDLITSAAILTLQYIDPYNLASFYLRQNQQEACGRIIQQLLNDDNPDNDGLALHLKGLLYLQNKDTIAAKATFFQALQKIKSPWLTYNNLGVIYFYQYNNDSARYMFLKGFETSKKTYPLHLNYGNLLYRLYQTNHNSKTLDSAISNYKEAIDINKNEKNLYLAILPALADKDKIEFEEYSRKLIEMDETNYLTYYQLGSIENSKGNFSDANRFFQKAIDLCPDSTTKSQINDWIKK